MSKLNSNTIMKPSSKSPRLARLAAAGVALLVTAAPLAAHAQRKSPLEDAPAIRKRVELRDTRFEIGVQSGSTITQDYFHTVMLNGRVAFHFTDWLSLAVVGGAALTNSDTAYQSQLVGTLPATMNPGVAREPTAANAQGAMQQIKSLGLAQVEFAPFTGKYSLFGKFFAHYDFYIFGGAGFMNVAAKDASVCANQSPNMPQFYCQTGWKFGGNVGIGLHSFFTDWLALNVELRDVLARLDPSGRDVNGDGIADSNDNTLTSTYFATVGLTFFLPGHAAISP